MLFSPLEQFKIIPLFILKNTFFDISITNQTITLFFILFVITTLFFIILKQKNLSLYIVPNNFQIVIELIYSTILNLVNTNINGKSGQRFFPLIFSIFLFILLMNMMGLIPYSFTVTSQIIVTLSLSLTLFLGINIICVKKHNLEFFSLFLPAGTSIYLALLLVPVEFISYLFRPLSLAIRLFCNITASHVLLKITAGFAWSLMNVSGFSFLLHYIPLFIILPLIGLELFMSITQAYVFSLMLCIYLNDALNLH